MRLLYGILGLGNNLGHVVKFVRLMVLGKSGYNRHKSARSYSVYLTYTSNQSTLIGTTKRRPS